MNTLKIKLRATNLNPFKSGYDESDPFTIEIDNLISADKIIICRKLMIRIKKYVRENYIADVDFNSPLQLETQLNSLGEFCVSLKKDWFKQYFIVKVSYS